MDDDLVGRAKHLRSLGLITGRTKFLLYDPLRVACLIAPLYLPVHPRYRKEKCASVLNQPEFPSKLRQFPQKKKSGKHDESGKRGREGGGGGRREGTCKGRTIGGKRWTRKRGEPVGSRTTINHAIIACSHVHSRIYAWTWTARAIYRLPRTCENQQLKNEIYIYTYM